jgi:hypothetical protein
MAGQEAASAVAVAAGPHPDGSPGASSGAQLASASGEPQVREGNTRVVDIDERGLPDGGSSGSSCLRLLGPTALTRDRHHVADPSCWRSRPVSATSSRQ